MRAPHTPARGTPGEPACPGSVPLPTAPAGGDGVSQQPSLRSPGRGVSSWVQRLFLVPSGTHRVLHVQSLSQGPSKDLDPMPGVSSRALGHSSVLAGEAPVPPACPAPESTRRVCLSHGAKVQQQQGGLEPRRLVSATCKGWHLRSPHGPWDPPARGPEPPLIRPQMPTPEKARELGTQPAGPPKTDPLARQPSLPTPPSPPHSSPCRSSCPGLFPLPPGGDLRTDSGQAALALGGRQGHERTPTGPPTSAPDAVGGSRGQRAPCRAGRGLGCSSCPPALGCKDGCEGGRGEPQGQGSASGPFAGVMVRGATVCQSPAASPELANADSLPEEKPGAVSRPPHDSSALCL
ncbi:basic proline-rich protein-like [Choloepus didactylus]|uniref:basic proline-rich protein-like n=1 Tax=Choloepus didactylus TaxID=27675 RepID=UPI00189D6999|nr:basic proline-rich protein-like [Choloepus didactylus]